MTRNAVARETLGVVIHKARDLRIEPVGIDPLDDHSVEIAIGAGGICGSDLHYYQDGHIGPIVLKEPMVLGHEIAGTVTAIGRAVSMLKPGDKVAVNPSRACKACRYCLAGLPHHCLNMLFYGSAMRFPHVSGGFRKVLVAEERQCVAVPAETPLEKAAFAEPLAVCLHAVNRAGSLTGKQVLVTGCGPIGALTVMAARHAGAEHITVTDVTDAAVATALRIGADDAINVATHPERLAGFAVNKGHFDVIFEASGNERAIRAAMEIIRPQGVLVLVGLGGETKLMINHAVNREIDIRGSFRFDGEFETAVRAIVSGRINPLPLLTDVIPIENAVSAFELAADRTRAMKVQLSFA